MIPMRDGVKLYTVIVLPKGARNAPIAADANAVRRVVARAARESLDTDGGRAAALRRAVRRRRLHPRLPGRARQVQVRG